MKIERIIITLNEDGTFRGASSQDFGGLPVPIAEVGLGEIGKAIGGSLLAAVAAKEAEIAALADFKTRAEQGIQQVIAVVNDPNIGEEETAATIFKIVAQGTAPEAERKKSEIYNQIAELEKQLTP